MELEGFDDEVESVLYVAREISGKSTLGAPSTGRMLIDTSSVQDSSAQSQ